IYLLTFVIAFSERGRRIVPGAEWLAPAAVTLLWVPFGSAAGWPIGPLLLVEFAGLGIVATTLHGRLAADRPAPEHLTEFYLVMSAGGVLASSLVAVVAPTLFKGIWEYPLLLILALGAMALVGGPAAAAPTPGPRRRFDLSPFFAGAPARLAPYVVVAGLLGAGLVASGSLGLEAGVRWLLVGGLILLVGGQPRFLFVSTALVLALAVFVLSPQAVFQDRSFFGVTQVLRPADQPLTILMNGTTVHGIQSSDPAARGIPGSYYAPHGPLGEVFGLARARPGADAGRTIGVVGLGSGTVAAWARPGDALTFFEIDPLVIRVASDPDYFTWLSDAAVRPEIVLGDARLSLESVPGPTFDVLVLDAFSSDAIPAHLLTTEALADDARVLRPGGLLAIHVSNRYYDLGPAVASAARAAGLTVLERVYEPSEADRRLNAALSDWLIGTTDPTDVPRLEAAGWRTVREGVTPLTDDHPDLLRLLRIGLW
ncbi:MAG TPA: fused MFS/spermidine synthase, partial [Patescibacteria group bacterium]|nr:fused MFS/spermidine synthase [Patescibacteria group bacterium]